MTLSEWLERIEHLHPKSWDLGLERVGEVARRLDVTRPAPRVVLVAGTNGKGSTCEAIELIASHTGLVVGKTTSPHLVRFNERIAVDGVPASDEEIIAAFEAIDEARGDITLSYFEFGALAAMLVFKRRKVDLAVLEIGLGGRLDAMNVAEPDVSVITRIALDHQDWLGDDRETIGREKAGIMRAGKTCIVGDLSPPDSLAEAAAEVGASVRFVGRDFGTTAEFDGAISVLPIPRENLLAAIEACRTLDLEIDAAGVQDALRHWSLPGRLQWATLASGARVLLDVAHNPDAALRLLQHLEDEDVTNCRAVFGIYGDKEIRTVVETLNPRVGAWYVAGMAVDRGAATDEIAAAIEHSHGVVAGKYDKIPLAFEAACEGAKAGDIILVFGSFVIVGGVLEMLGEHLP